MYNQVILIGHLGNDPEMKYTPSGVAVTGFSLAVNKTWVDTATGEKKEKTIWVRVSAWRKLAETASQYLAKGSRVMVVGEIEAVRAYTAKSGEPGASLEVTAQTIKFLSARNENGASESHGLASATQAVQNAPGNEADVLFMEDANIPF